MAKQSSFKITVNNSDKFKRLLEDKKEEILMDAGSFVAGEAKWLAPIDTGALEDSIEHLFDGDNTVQIGTDIEYAEYVELGTSRQVAQPYLLPAYERNKEAIKKIMRTHVAELGRGL